MGPFLVGSSQKRESQPVELLFLSVIDIIVASSATIYLIMKLPCGIIRRYIVLYFLPKETLLLLPKYKTRGFVICQNGANIHSSVPTSLQYPAKNLDTSVVILFIFVVLWNRPLNEIRQSLLSALWYFHNECLMSSWLNRVSPNENSLKDRASADPVTLIGLAPIYNI